MKDDRERLRVRELVVRQDTTSFRLVSTYAGKPHVRPDGIETELPGLLKEQRLETPELGKLHTNRLAEIRFRYRDHGTGAIFGLFAGAAIGAAIGFGIAQQDCGSCTTDDRIGWGKVGAAVFGSIGGLVGLLVGGAVGTSSSKVNRTSPVESAAVENLPNRVSSVDRTQ